MGFGSVFRVAAACVAILAVLTTTGCDQDTMKANWEKAKEAAAVAKVKAQEAAAIAAVKAQEAAAIVAVKAQQGVEAGKAAWHDAKIEEQWKDFMNSTAVRDAKQNVKEALAQAATAAKSGGKAAADAANKNVQKAMDVLSAKYQAATKPVTGEYIIPPKCLLAMAVGSGAVVNSSSALSLAKLGYASVEVEATSLHSLWQNSMKDLDAGRLFERLQSRDAEGLAADSHFGVTGDVATASVGFCGVVDDLCNGCMVASNDTAAAPELTVIYQ